MSEDTIVIEVPIKIPNLANATPGFLADELGKTRESMKALMRYEGICKEGLKGRAQTPTKGDPIEVQGRNFTATISEVSQSRIDTEKLKKTYGEDWYNEHCKEITFQKVSTSRR